jgi:hypothetical protein
MCCCTEGQLNVRAVADSLIETLFLFYGWISLDGQLEERTVEEERRH